MPLPSFRNTVAKWDQQLSEASRERLRLCLNPASDSNQVVHTVGCIFSGLTGVQHVLKSLQALLPNTVFDFVFRCDNSTLPQRWDKEALPLDGYLFGSAESMLAPDGRALDLISGETVYVPGPEILILGIDCTSSSALNKNRKRNASCVQELTSSTGEHVSMVKKLLAKFRPRIILIENVTEMGDISMMAKDNLAALQMHLCDETLGINYALFPHDLEAKCYGDPVVRFRKFIPGYDATGMGELDNEAIRQEMWKISQELIIADPPPASSYLLDPSDPRIALWTNNIERIARDRPSPQSDQEGRLLFTNKGWPYPMSQEEMLAHLPPRVHALKAIGHRKLETLLYKYKINPKHSLDDESGHVLFINLQHSMVFANGTLVDLCPIVLPNSFIVVIKGDGEEREVRPLVPEELFCFMGYNWSDMGVKVTPESFSYRELTILLGKSFHLGSLGVALLMAFVGLPVLPIDAHGGHGDNGPKGPSSSSSGDVLSSQAFWG